MVALVKLLVVAATTALSAVALLACPGPKMPSGPPPEYEEPPAPSWLVDSGAEDAGASGPAAEDAAATEPELPPGV